MKNWGEYSKIRSGSVAEWLKAHDSKSCMGKTIGGSNPLASARKYLKNGPLWVIFEILFVRKVRI